MNRWALWTGWTLLGWVALAAAGCEGAGAGAVGNLGVEGASCLSSPECAPPLQCIANVCTALEAAAGGDITATDALDAEASGPDPAGAGPADSDPADSEGGGDRQLITEITEWADLDEYDLTWVDADAHGPGPVEDTASVAFSECEELGIAPGWAGGFVGSIDYDIDTGGLIPASLESGAILTGGQLAFDIVCIDSKLVVQGLMDGSGQVLGRTEQGDFPFTVKLAGFYSPATHTLTAQMVDGIVLIYGLLEVYFSGTFTGELTPFGDFDGVWQGSASETNVETITGLASGIGTWTADPVE